MKLQIFSSATGADLVKVADNILKKHNGTTEIESFLNIGTIPPHIQGQTVLSILRKLNQDEWFDVCALNKLSKMHNVKLTQEHEAFFSSLHCVHWSDMHADTREYLFALIVKYFEDVIVAAKV